MCVSKSSLFNHKRCKHIWTARGQRNQKLYNLNNQFATKQSVIKFRSFQGQGSVCLCLPLLSLCFKIQQRGPKSESVLDFRLAEQFGSVSVILFLLEHNKFSAVYILTCLRNGIIIPHYVDSIVRSSPSGQQLVFPEFPFFQFSVIE